MNNFYINPKQEKAESFTKRYTIGAKLTNEQGSCELAKHHQSAYGQNFFYIMTNSKTGKFFNHNDDCVTDLKDKVAGMDKNMFEYRKVTEEAFTSYLKFLSTDNEVHLRTAERSM